MKCRKIYGNRIADTAAHFHILVVTKSAAMKILFSLALLCAIQNVYAQTPFSGVETNLGNLFRTSNAITRSISPENRTGEPGKGGMADPKADSGKRNVANASAAARELGKGWKVNPIL